MPDRQQHQQEVQLFLRQHFSSSSWEFTLPHGRGNETYFARSHSQTCFVKLGADVSRYQAVAALGLTPPVLAAGVLEDGTPIIVQPTITGRNPRQRDFQLHLERFATAIHQLHHCADVIVALPKVSSDLYRQAGMEAFIRLQQRWACYKEQVPDVACLIDESLDYLGRQVQDFQGSGLVASHNDVCNANWLMSDDGHLYLIDLESMAQDDPAEDLGAILWWYYPPAQRHRFLEIVGYANDPAFEHRMQVRMAMHCLSITLPRAQSFDQFDPVTFPEALDDFRAAVAGRENPQGFGN